jgi:hypothetical protein
MKHIKSLEVIITSLLILCLINACSKSKTSTIIAEIDNKPIYEDELNTIIKQELFDELNRISELKKKALEQLINVKLVQDEANKNGMPYQDFIDYYTDRKINIYGVDSLLKYYKISSVLHLHDKNMYTVSTDSPISKVSKLYYLKGAIIDELLDSLRKTKEINCYIYPPKSPLIDLTNLHGYYRGNIHSKVNVTIVSDFDCAACINAHVLYDSIYHIYKDKVRFGYIHYSAIPTLGEIASDAAHEQGHFWEFHDSLYTYKGYIDSSAVYNIAKKILNMETFRKDIESIERKNKIEKTINQLTLAGVYATPTVIINGRLIINSDSPKEICHLIDDELNKHHIN